MTRDESIELAAFLGMNLSAGFVVSFALRDDRYVEVAYPERLACDTLILDEIALERGLTLNWQERHGEHIATFRSRPVRTSFTELTQDELDTCFEVAFGPKRLFKARCGEGGIIAMHNQDGSDEGQRWTMMQANVTDYVLSLVIWYESGVEVRIESNDDIIPGVADLARLFEHLKLINVDFGF